MSWRDRHHRHHHIRHHHHGRWPGGPPPWRGGPWHDLHERRTWIPHILVRLRWRVFVMCGVAIGLSLAAGGLLRPDGELRWWPIAGTFILLWIAAGAISWQLMRPFIAVVRAARAIGDGKLSTRIETHHPGELGALATAINDMAARIEKQVGDQRQLLAVVSHELRTPLGHMRLLLETGRDAGGTDARLIDELEKEVLELDRLVDRLLASSRLEFATFDHRKVDLAAVAVAAVEAAGVPADRLAVEGDVRIEGDATLLRRAIANLLENAHGHGGGAVAIRVMRRGDEVVVEVDDAGEGVPAERREALFEPFARGGGSGSLGLGLALVRRIAQAHGGRAWIDDRPGGGARVAFAVAVVAAVAAAR